MLSDEDFSDGVSDSDDESEPEEKSTQEREAALEKLVPALDPSEYGKMPASFYVNSQKVTTDAEPMDVAPEEPQNETEKEPVVRAPIFPRDKFDGVDSDDETDEEEDNVANEESDEDNPEVVGEIEPDMDEEQEEFLEFSRQALGISNEEWENIINDRKSRGGERSWAPIIRELMVGFAAFVPVSTASNASHMPPKPPAPTAEKPSRTKAPEVQSSANPDLDSFETVMQALDLELARTRTTKGEKKNEQPAKPNKGKGKAVDPETHDDGDIDAAMDAEIKAMLDTGDDEEDPDTGIDYNLIKNFLESFKSQAGLAGPVGNLAGRLQPDWKLPRDES